MGTEVSSYDTFFAYCICHICTYTSIFSAIVLSSLRVLLYGNRGLSCSHDQPPDENRHRDSELSTISHTSSIVCRYTEQVSAVHVLQCLSY